MERRDLAVIVAAAYALVLSGCCGGSRRCGPPCSPCVVMTAPQPASAPVAKAAPPEAPPEAPPAGSNDDWMKFAQPGEQHAKLKALVGDWAVHGTIGEGDKSIATDSTASFSMILGDRYLRQEAKGSFQGMPFEGRGVIGYDNGKKRWVSVWIDNFGTGVMLGDGEETQPGKQWTFKSSMAGPQGTVTTRDVLTIVSEKELTWESWMGDAAKPMMSLRYTRK